MIQLVYQQPTTRFPTRCSVARIFHLHHLTDTDTNGTPRLNFSEFRLVDCVPRGLEFCCEFLFFRVEILKP